MILATTNESHPDLKLMKSSDLAVFNRIDSPSHTWLITLILITLKNNESMYENGREM